MKIQHVPFGVTDWTQVPKIAHAGKAGQALWRTFEAGNLRVRVVEYSPGYEADHWCSRGHVLYVLAGEIDTRLQDGRAFTLAQGTSYQVAEGEPHLSTTKTGATLFIVD